MLLKTTLTCRICTVSCHFWLFPYSITFFAQDLLGSVACAHLVNLPRITAFLDVADIHIFSESQGSQSRQSISGRNKNGGPCGTYCYQTSSRSISNPLLWLVRRYFLPIRYGVLRISSALVLFRSCNLFYCSELAAPESPKMAETWIDKRGSWRGEMGTGISLIVDWENGIYSLGLGFSHWEWDEQL